MSKPLLTIYIPTFNRAKLLQRLLGLLLPQIADAGDEVELVISDNCSTDNTREVVETLKQRTAITYHRNKKNLGPVINIMQCADISSGEYIWFMGDDDLVRPGAVAYLLSVLREHPEVDYVFMNATIAHEDDIENILSNLDVEGPDQKQPTTAAMLSDLSVSDWQDLIGPEINASFMVPFQCSVFRASVWKEFELGEVDDEVGSALKTTYPHVLAFAHTMFGRPAYHVGYPYVVAVEGNQAYTDNLPAILAVWIPAIISLFEDMGMSAEKVRKCRQYLLREVSAKSVRKMLLYKDTPGRHLFSLKRFLWENRFDPLGLVKCAIVLMAPKGSGKLKQMLKRNGR